MKNVFLHPYKAGSESAKALSSALGIKRIALEGSKFKGSEDKTVINWGASSVSEEVAKCRIINKPEAVAIAADKLKFFNKLQEHNGKGRGVVSFPQFTTSQRDAGYWLEDGNIVIARTVLNGHSGNGIVVCEKARDLVEASLYTLYIPKKQEYRVHVAGGLAVDVQRKARREDVPDDQVNWRIRNHDNGFIFARNESLGEVSRHVLTNAQNAVKAIGLDFGAVDIIFNERHQRSYVLEVNTAPGLSGETLDNYVKRMTELVESNEAKRKYKSPIRDDGPTISLEQILNRRLGPSPDVATPAAPDHSLLSHVRGVVGDNSGGYVVYGGDGFLYGWVPAEYAWKQISINLVSAVIAYVQSNTRQAIVASFNAGCVNNWL